MKNIIKYCKDNGLKPVMVERSMTDHPELLIYVEPCDVCGKKHIHGAGGSFDFGSGNGPRTPHCPIKSSNQEIYLIEINNETRQKLEKELDKLGYKYKKGE